MLLIIILFGTVLRIYDLGAESFWFDEIGSIALANRDLPSLFFKSHLSPFYFLLLRYWMKLFGLSEFASRFLSVIFSIGAIYLLYKTGTILFNKRIGLISSLIISLSPFHLFYAQEVRNYALFAFLSLLSMLSFLKMAKKEFNASNKSYVYYAITTILLLYTHLWGALVVFAQNFFFLLQKVQQKKRWIITQVIILLIFLIWIIPFTIYFLGEREYLVACLDWVPKMHFSSLIDTFKTFSYGGTNYGGYAYYINPKKIGLSPTLLYILGILFILGAIPPQKGDYNRTSFLLIWLFIPISILSALSLILFPMFVIRYIIPASPAYYILVAKGIDKIRSRLCQIGMILTIAFFTFPSLSFYYENDVKIRWNEIVGYIEENKRDGDIIVIGRSDQVTLLDYIRIKDKDSHTQFKSDIREDLGIKMFSGEFVYYYEGRDKIVGINDVGQLKRIVEKGLIKENGNIWLILSKWIHSTGNPEEIKEYLASFCLQEGEKHFEGVDVFYYSQEVNRR